MNKFLYFTQPLRLKVMSFLLTNVMVQINSGGRGTRYNLIKWHISSWLFTKLDDFLPFISYMVYWSLLNKKMRILLISWSSKNGNEIFQSLNHVDIYLKPQFLINSGYYFVPSPSTALILSLVKGLLGDDIIDPSFLNIILI